MMYRARGRTIGTLIIGAILVVAAIYAAFGRSGSTTMQTPHIKVNVGAVDFSLQPQPVHPVSFPHNRDGTESAHA